MFERGIAITIKSKRENICLIEKFTEEICDILNIYSHYYGNILLSLTAAVENAITHGNKNNPEKEVTIRFEAKQEGLSFMIIDEGEGFDHKGIPDPITSQLDENKGRGLFLIKSLSDNVKFHENGKCIEIIFNISEANREITQKRINQLRQYQSVSNNKIKVSRESDDGNTLH